MTSRSTTILCLATYVKGHEFLRECKRLGCRVLLLTLDKHRDAEWPSESIDERFLMPQALKRDEAINAVSYLARTEPIDRIVPLDEFDLEMASALREHLRIPGMGETTVRYFRDKLAMRMRAEERGVPVPEFVPVINHDRIRTYLETVPPPWVLKPRLSASAIGIRKLHRGDELWPILEELGDRQSFHLMERFIPGDVFHVDSIVSEGDVVFAEAHGYLNPPFEVYHGGGLFATRTLDPRSEEWRQLTELNARVATALGMVRGVLHTEFIRGASDGRFYFLETAARVGGAFIVEMVEAATGVNLWREWARVEVANARGERYEVPRARRDYAGLVISLAKQEWPDTGAYADGEIVWRLRKRHHAGLIVSSPRRERVEELLGDYMRRFREDFHTSLPAATEAVD
ncbi:MAG: ATP-grasp domain-containing protein [Gemmatimonadaceae bacterium]